jgi:hypothetical protein
MLNPKGTRKNNAGRQQTPKSRLSQKKEPSVHNAEGSFQKNYKKTLLYFIV